jgi:hypothetical protein
MEFCLGTIDPPMGEPATVEGGSRPAVRSGLNLPRGVAPRS